MSHRVTMASLSRAYPDLLRAALDEGAVVESRSGRTKELTALLLSLHDPEACIVGRVGFEPEFLELEQLMLLAGSFDVDLIRQVVPRAAELIATATAYGPRVKHQLRAVEAELTADASSRRAVVYVGRPNDLQTMHDPERSESYKHEMPCTMTWQFLIREGHLHMLVSMRSWDLVWGLTYDVPCFVAVQAALGRSLGVPIGSYEHFAGSAHVYERHWNVTTWEQDDRLHIGWLGNDMEETERKAATLLRERKANAG